MRAPRAARVRAERHPSGKDRRPRLLGTPTRLFRGPVVLVGPIRLKLQIAGLSAGYDATVAARRPRRRGSFAVYYLVGRPVIAVDAVNSPHDFVHGKKLVAARASRSIRPRCAILRPTFRGSLVDSLLRAVTAGGSKRCSLQLARRGSPHARGVELGQPILLDRAAFDALEASRRARSRRPCSRRRARQSDDSRADRSMDGRDTKPATASA